MRTEDGHIIHKCLNGEPEAFGFLVDKYKESIYAFAYTKLRNFHDAEDVTQEVFIKAYQKLRTLRRWDNFLAWIYAITSNLCKNWIRAQSRRPDHEFMEDNDRETLEVLSINSHRERLARESLHESLQEALDLLPEAYRQVLTLYYLGGMSNKEIARFLGTSPTAVKQRLMRARSRLKKEMLAMMSATYEGQRLPTGFTFHIVEAVKRIRIQPVPRTAGLPWGLLSAAGFIITALVLNPNVSPPGSIPSHTSWPLPKESKVMKREEIPVNLLNISDMLAISSKREEAIEGEVNLTRVQKKEADVPLAVVQEPSPAGGGWLEFDGEGSFAVARDGGSFSIGKDEEFTVEAWIYPKDILRENDEWVIIGKPGSFELLLAAGVSPLVGNSGMDLKFVIGWRVGPIIEWFTHVVWMTNKSLGEWIFDEWHHVAVSAGKEKRVVLYFDGRQITSVPYPGPAISDSDLYIGGIPGRENSFFRGAIDEVRISSKILEPQMGKIPYAFGRGRYRADKHTIALWHFDKGEDMLKDSSDNGHMLVSGGSLAGGQGREREGKSVFRK